MLIAFCWLLLSPYELMRWMEKSGALERTFILVGTVTTAAGVALYTWTPY